MLGKKVNTPAERSATINRATAPLIIRAVAARSVLYRRSTQAMKKYGAVILLVLIPSLCEAEWKYYVARDDNFQVRFPGTPDVGLDIAGNRVYQLTVRGSYDAQIYTLKVGPIPKHESVKEQLKATRDELVEFYKRPEQPMTINRDMPIWCSGYPGWQCGFTVVRRLRNLGTPHGTDLRIILVENRQYVLIRWQMLYDSTRANSTEYAGTNLEAQYFFSSFRLLKRPKERQVEESLLGNWVASRKTQSLGPLKDYRQIKFEKEGNVQVNGRRWLGTYTADATTKSNAIELDNHGKKFHGIFQIKNDKLVIAVVDESEPRPTELSSANETTAYFQRPGDPL